jgi:hypothetical protein
LLLLRVCLKDFPSLKGFKTTQALTVILLDWTSIGVDLAGVDLAGLDSQFQKFGLDWIERSGASWSANGPFLIRKEASPNSTLCFRHIVSVWC